MGFAYDASGDVTSDNTNTYLYDAEGRICAVRSEPVPGTWTMTGYLYDADGTRVAKGTITNWSCDPATSGFSTTNDYILGPGGEQMTEMTMNGSGSALVWEHTNVWAAGKIIATYSQDNTGSQTQASLLHFYFDDPLGSRRVQTDFAGVVEKTCQSLPFGDGETCLPTPTEHLFTGKERDSESGNDYFEARYYSSSMGRFMSPDWSANPVPIPFVHLENPQTLNLYAYVQNNPLSRRDSNGHDDYTYDQSGKQTNFKKDGFWHNLFKGNTYTMNLTGGGSVSLYGPVNALANGQQYTIVSAADTMKGASDFVNKNAGTASGMSLDQFKNASKNGAAFDYKQQLSGNSLYMWGDGKAYDSDGIGNITWGYLSTVAVGGSITNGIAHLGAAYAQDFIDKSSRPEWIFSHTLGDRPQDFDAINAGRKWGGEDYDHAFAQAAQNAAVNTH
jgi:RHS repeat-associated protein